MTYGELDDAALSWATESAFGVNFTEIPKQVIICPIQIEEFFKEFHTTIEKHELDSEEVKSGFQVSKGEKRVLFCRGGIGASMFADLSYILCNCENIQEIIFVGTGGGLGKSIETADINIPPSCLRFDKVLEILLPLEAPAKAHSEISVKIKQLIEEEVKDLGISVHSSLHATVPFLLSETKQFLNELQKQNVRSIDMELSVLYALANHFHKRATGIIRIGDLPLRGLPIWESKKHKLDLKLRVHTAILNAIINYVFT
jgi:purine-nucleoside phosphorylase